MIFSFFLRTSSVGGGGEGEGSALPDFLFIYFSLFSRPRAGLATVCVVNQLLLDVRFVDLPDGVTQDFSSTFLLRCVPSFFSREGFSHSFPWSTVKSIFLHQRINRSPLVGFVLFKKKIRTRLDLLSEHPPSVRGKNVKTFRWDQGLQTQNLFWFCEGNPGSCDCTEVRTHAPTSEGFEVTN